MLEKKNQGGNGGGGGADIDIISSRNTIEVSRSGDIFDVNVANEDSRNFFVKNFHEFMDAVQTIANLYIDGDTVGNVIQLLGNIDMTAPTADDEANYVLSNGDYLIDLPNKTYNLRQYLRYTKIVSYGAKRVLQLLHPNAARTSYDTFQLNVIRLTAENIGIGGDIAAWIDEFHHGDVSRSLPCEFQRYLFSSPGNVYYDLRSCNITCSGASQTTPNAFNPLLTMGNTLNAGLWVSAMYLTDCRFIAGRSLNTPDPNLNAPIVINSNWFENRRKILQFKQMSKEVNDTVAETGAPNIQIRTDNVAQAQTTWRSHQWEVTTDGTALVSCSAGEDCLAFAPKLALNDLYLQGTPLTPPGNPPTKNFVSLVSLLQNQGRQVIDSQSLEYFIGQINGNDDFVRVDGNVVFSRFFEYSNNFIFFDAHGHIDVEKTLYLMPIRGYVQLCGLLYGTNYGESATCQTIYAECGGVGNSILKNSVKGARAQGLKSADIEVIEYNGENYLALVKNWSGGDLFIKGYSSLTQEEIDEDLILLYYDGTRQKWYSDSDLTQEVSFTVLETSGRFPASLDFGGNTSQVVAGDGTFLNWGDKLGYWEGQTADLPPIGSREANKLYITTDY